MSVLKLCDVKLLPFLLWVKQLSHITPSNVVQWGELHLQDWHQSFSSSVYSIIIAETGKLTTAQTESTPLEERSPVASPWAPAAPGAGSSSSQSSPHPADRPAAAALCPHVWSLEVYAALGLGAETLTSADDCTPSFDSVPGRTHMKTLKKTNSNQRCVNDVPTALFVAVKLTVASVR